MCRRFRHVLLRPKPRRRRPLRTWSGKSHCSPSKATTRQEFDAAEARSKVADAAVTEAETVLAYASVTAPFDGVVTRKLAEAG